MIETLIAEWGATAIVNAPVLVFMLAAIWDLRRNLIACSTKNEEWVERLIEVLYDQDEDEHNS